MKEMTTMRQPGGRGWRGQSDFCLMMVRSDVTEWWRCEK
jgi:hypothetical protein